jgi:KDO2-lipid IV(A) lauroyltransferase
VSDVPLAKRARRTARVWAIRAGLWLVGRLPFRLAWAFGGLVGAAAWHVARHDRALALQHLAGAFPEWPEAERRRVARACFVHFGHAAAEAAQIRRLDARLEAYVTYAGDGERRLREASAAGKGFIFVTGHLGSWELLARRIVRSGVPSTVIAARSWDRRIDEMVTAFRASGGVPTLFREDAGGGRTLLRSMREGKALGILIDQDTKVQGVFVPFFGRAAFTPRAAADLAIRFGCPVFVGWSRRRGPRPGDGYVLEVEPVAYDAAPLDRDAEAVRLTAACTARLEHAIRRTPAEWVWMHRRWRHRPPGEAGDAGGHPRSPRGDAAASDVASPGANPR